jgi:hypothetical protein
LFRACPHALPAISRTRPIQRRRSLADFGKLIAYETEKWGDVIRAANKKPE